MSTNQKLIDCNNAALGEAAELLALLDQNQYTAHYKPVFQSTIGAHFRHVIEHYQCFFAQLERSEFCYDARERKQQLELDPTHASSTIDHLIGCFRKFPHQHFNRQFTAIDEQISEPVKTSLQRELLFLQSHTVHHFAIIAAMSRAFGVHPNHETGVAISTRNHAQKVLLQASRGKISCAR